VKDRTTRAILPDVPAGSGVHGVEDAGERSEKHFAAGDHRLNAALDAFIGKEAVPLAGERRLNLRCGGPAARRLVGQHRPIIGGCRARGRGGEESEASKQPPPGSE